MDPCYSNTGKTVLVATTFQAGLVSFLHCPALMINSIFSHHFVQIQAERGCVCATESRIWFHLRLRTQKEDYNCQKKKYSI